MTDLTKSQKRHLRQLAGQCYEKEMGLVLDELFGDFQKWKSSEMSIWDLNDKIHEYHNGTARELWKLYDHMNNSALAVAVALRKGIIKIEDVQENCRELVESKAVAMFGTDKDKP